MDKDKIKVLFETDADGYITGYQQEFWDGRQWQTPFDTTNAVELTADEIGSIVMGATKYADGKLTVDADKQAELEAEANKHEPSPEEKIAALQQSNSELQSALLELSDLVLNNPSTN